FGYQGISGLVDFAEKATALDPIRKPVVMTQLLGGVESSLAGFLASPCGSCRLTDSTGNWCCTGLGVAPRRLQKLGQSMSGKRWYRRRVSMSERHLGPSLRIARADWFDGRSVCPRRAG